MQIEIGLGSAAIARLDERESSSPQEVHRGAIGRVDRRPDRGNAVLRGEGDEPGQQFLSRPVSPTRMPETVDHLLRAIARPAKPAQPISAPLAGSTTAPVP